MFSQAHITLLPRELRNMIYDELLGKKTYIYDDEAGKLKQPDSTSVYLAFALLCRIIHHEMYDYAFRNKTCTFKPIQAHERHYTWPNDFGWQFFARRQAEEMLLMILRRYITDNVQDKLLYHHPQFRRLLNCILRDRCPSPLLGQRCGEAPSLQTYFMRHALRLILEWSPPLDEKILEMLNTMSKTDLIPWVVPSHHTVSEGQKNHERNMVTCFHSKGKPPKNRDSKYCFSAAAGTIRFLHSMPIEARSRLRRIIIVENQPSVAHPQCHAQGLISFCLEKPQLRIERRIDLSKCAFQCQWFKSRYQLYAELWPPNKDYTNNPRDIPHAISSITSWLVEAKALASQGMPHDAFTLVLEDLSSTELGFAIFQELKWVACVQLLFELDIEALHAVHAPAWTEQIKCSWYNYRGFPQDAEDTISRKSIVRCNFETGGSWIADEMAKPGGMSADALRTILRNIVLPNFTMCL
ncbi:hypothetical protein A1F94_001462 [Pyrenophora tritici-repentis]|uniref:Uncharacterized protein n=2 Tax=Pyrenophora tritici-repentis TaxID=45151 RepID=A0A2W1H513_9PLEO|nr:uncharacterized protein PTRG_01702 [Pyrenophora tritici-repentis Pt-1C-BFP]KAF7577941.1 hypothetical protein PtrM4_021810 [Pyrenophora tritici-repentis]EDU41140.1 predicted protein [Pyrenophora tritici-repentis Pt-1C-BFP]KAG9388570.1 hypothetical protein A1F94_001462 [Pyrenophora tritici-repentis]KAI1513868.1 hypothetical protein Ptr86124_007770 [Pyrenophora tritici-repentis]KAI1674028.1 hypothetical protein L13192_00775 [Pyrenophora tritici-repentis]